MTQFNKFPFRSGSGGGGGGSAVAAGGGPLGSISAFPKSALDSSTFLDVKGWPVPGGATVVALDFTSWGGTGGPLNGLDSSGAVIWAATTGAAGTLSTTTGVTINSVSRPVWDGSSTDCIVACHETVKTAVFFVSINIQTGVETLLGSVVPADLTPDWARKSSTSMQLVGSNILFVNAANATGVRTLNVDISGAPTIVSEFDTDYQPTTGALDFAAFGKYTIIGDYVSAIANNSVTFVNAETGAVNTVEMAYPGTVGLMPFTWGFTFGDLFISKVFNASNSGIRRAARWNAQAVGGYWKSLAQVYGIDGGSL